MFEHEGLFKAMGIEVTERLPADVKVLDLLVLMVYK